MNDLPEGDEFDRYCDEHNIQPSEYPAAFAAFLNEISGGTWDGDVRQVEGDTPNDEPPVE